MHPKFPSEGRKKKAQKSVVDNRGMKVKVVRCMQWNSVIGSQSTTQRSVEAVEGNSTAKMLTPIGTSS